MTKTGSALTAMLAMAAAPVLVSCHGTEAQYSIGGDISGTTVPVVLKLNGGNDISMSGDGSFKFDKKLLKNDTFNVQVVDTKDQCTVVNGAGTVNMSNINDVGITCIAQASQNPQLAILRMANLDGSQEFPPVTTAASGVGGIIVLPSTTQPMQITGGITFSGLAPLGNQIGVFLGAPGTNGPQLFALVLASDGLTAVVPPGTTLSPTALTSLLSGNLYFNVPTAANQNGEIRGAIQLQGGVAASLTGLDKSQVVPPTTSGALGLGTLLADRATGRVLISYITHTVTGTTAASLNTSSGAGAVIIAFPNQRSNIDGALTNLANPASTAVLSAQSLSDFDNSLLYYNVTSAGFPNGEIRGNISPLAQ
ncbi:MAG TPA: CHRD domain-containing protein [Burkholderiales bacterium]|nr:CHRD domain-containing protein [Burkholderiales bacterium]